MITPAHKGYAMGHYTAAYPSLSFSQAMAVGGVSTYPKPEIPLSDPPTERSPANYVSREDHQKALDKITELDQDISRICNNLANLENELAQLKAAFQAAVSQGSGGHRKPGYYEET